MMHGFYSLDRSLATAFAPRLTRKLLVLILFASGLGCVEDPPIGSTVVLPTELGARFSPDSCGTIEGVVLWKGDVPKAEPYVVFPNPLAGAGLRVRQERARPNYPRVDNTSQGLAHAVVYLHGIELERSRPWDWPPVKVEMKNGEFEIQHGSTKSNIGFARRGSMLEMISRDPHYHACRTAGAAFFTIPFPDRDLPATRPLNNAGLVELSSGCGYYWMRGYVFADEHPYYAQTDEKGRFKIHDVPSGSYEIRCWHPSWVQDHHDRDPESGLVQRVYFKDPLLVHDHITVTPGTTGTVSFQLPGNP